MLRIKGTLSPLALAAVFLAAPLSVLAQIAVPPTVAQIGFAPATVQSGAISRLTVSFGNTNAAPATLLQPLTDTLPAGMIIANPAGVGGTCPTPAVAAAGGRALSYPANAAIPAGGCSIQVNVIATSTTRNTFYTDSIAAGALVTNLGTNTAAASGNITVQAAATVPNLVGLSPAAAANALQAAGLTLGAVTKSPSPAAIPYNAVFRQAPAAGTAAAPGSAVAVTISTGAGLATNPNRPLTSVPNYIPVYQQSEAAALERLCAAVQSADPATLSGAQRNLGANCTAIIGTYGGGGDAAGVQHTLDALSGKQNSAQQRTGLQFAGAQFANLGTRLAQLRQGASGASFSNLDFGLPGGNGLTTLFSALDGAFAPRGSAAAIPDAVPTIGEYTDVERGGGASADPTALSDTTRLGFFINGSLRRGTQSTTTLETPFDFKSNSITAGVDYRLTNHLIFGLALGHATGSTHFSDGTGRLDSKSNSGSLYGTYYQDALYVDVMGTLAHISYDAARNTTFSINPATGVIPSNCAATNCSVITTGATGARQLAFNTNVGYSFNRAALTYGPDIAVNYTRVNVNAFTENDPTQSGLSLTFGKDTGESLLAKAGGHASYAINTPLGVILPGIRAHYVHEFRNDQHALAVHFSSDPYANTSAGPISNFVVFTEPPDRGYFDYAAGVSGQFAFGIAAFVDYNALRSSYQRVHEFAIGIRIEHQIP